MTAAIVLAAGRSARFGRPKQLLRIDGRSLVARAVDAAREGGCDPVVVVVGADAEAVRRELADQPVRIVLNEQWEEGLASSVRAGVAAVATLAGVRAALILTCDQVRLAPAVVRGLLAAAAAAQGKMVASEYGGTVGVPALFDRSHFAGLLALRGESGAKQLLLRHAAAVLRVPWPDGASDLDAPEDLERHAGGGPGRAGL